MWHNKSAYPWTAAPAATEDPPESTAGTDGLWLKWTFRVETENKYVSFRLKDKLFCLEVKLTFWPEAGTRPSLVKCFFNRRSSFHLCGMEEEADTNQILPSKFNFDFKVMQLLPSEAGTGHPKKQFPICSMKSQIKSDRIKGKPKEPIVMLVIV